MQLLPYDLDALWPVIGPVAEPLLEQTDCKADDLRKECREGRAMCLAHGDEVVVVTLVPNRWHNDLEMVVWLAVTVSTDGRAFERRWPEVEGIARQLGAARVVFHSRRRGWERKLPSGWRLRSVSYEHEVAA